MPDFSSTPKAAGGGDVDGSPIHDAAAIDGAPSLKRPRAETDETIFSQFCNSVRAIRLGFKPL